MRAFYKIAQSIPLPGTETFFMLQGKTVCFKMHTEFMTEGFCPPVYHHGHDKPEADHEKYP